MIFQRFENFTFSSTGCKWRNRNGKRDVPGDRPSMDWNLHNNDTVESALVASSSSTFILIPLHWKGIANLKSNEYVISSETIADQFLKNWEKTKWGKPKFLLIFLKCNMEKWVEFFQHSLLYLHAQDNIFMVFLWHRNGKLWQLRETKKFFWFCVCILTIVKHLHQYDIDFIPCSCHS